MRPFLPLASWLGAIILPIVIVCSILTNLFFDTAFYHAGEARYDVQVTTGMSPAELDRVNRAIVRFFAGSESLPRSLAASGADPNVFKQKEILHMNDVRVLVQAIGRLQLIAGASLILLIVAGILCWESGGRQAIARMLTRGSFLILILVLIVGVLTYLAFDWLFLTFHEVTFQNDFWELDPRTDHLIQMFPFGFWYDAMLTVVVRVLLVAMICGTVGIILGRRDRRRA